MPGFIKVVGIPFCDYLPKPFTNLSRNQFGLIAASRSDGSIDVYDEKDSYYLIHHIPPSILTSIYALCWFERRLFATGGEGRVFELELASVHPKSSLLLHGGLVSRCIVASNETLISGNDGGYISLISVDNGSIELKTCIANINGKVLCLAVDTTGNELLAAGDSFGKVHILSLKTGSNLYIYSLGNEKSHNPVVVWCLAFAGDSLFSGDSRGTVSVWDVVVGGIVSSFKSHSADILALAVSSDNQSVFAAGVDPVICRFDLSSTESQSQWQPSGLIRGCQRDVRGLAFVDHGEASDLRSCSGEVDHLLAVGNETRLQVLPCPRLDPGGKTPVTKRKLKQSNVRQRPIYLPFWPLSVTPTLPLAMHCAEDTFAPSQGIQARLCLMQHADYLCLFRLPVRPKRSYDKSRKPQYYLKLAHIQPKRGEHIINCCISPCGKYIAYSDSMRSRVLKIEHPASWTFDPQNPSTLVSLSRLGWGGSSTRHHRSRTSSSTSSEADSDEHNSSRLFLDQSSADLFVDGGAGNVGEFDEHLVESDGTSRKRGATAALGEPEEDVFLPTDQRDDASALPAARLLSFTPDSGALITLEMGTQQLTCRNLSTGLEVWRFIPGTSDAGTATPVHLIKMIKLPFSSNDLSTSPTTLVALGCLDGRVIVHGFSSDFSRHGHLFTCPKVACLRPTAQAPRPVSIAFQPMEEGEKPRRGAHLAILYTTGQVTEWAITLENDLVVAPKVDTWFEEFWRRHGETWKKRMPRFHSIGYLNGGLEDGDKGKVLMLASRGFCISIDRREVIKDNDVKTVFFERNHKQSQRCLRIFSQIKPLLQCAVLADRIAALKMDIRDALDNLPPPLQKKRFGT